jgi:HlyD family secretion protein
MSDQPSLPAARAKIADARPPEPARAPGGTQAAAVPPPVQSPEPQAATPAPDASPPQAAAVAAVISTAAASPPARPPTQQAVRQVPDASAPKAAPGSGGTPAAGAAASAKSSDPEAPSQSTRRKLWIELTVAAVVLVGGAGGAYWWLHRAPGLPPGILVSNGRVEADEVDIDTKFAGRISEILVDEGMMVKAGQVVARIDVRDLEAQLAQARAQIDEARQTIVQSQANLIDMGSQRKLTAQELERARTLIQRGYETQEMVDTRQSKFNSADATYHLSEAKIVSAAAGMEASIHNAELIQVHIDDGTLIAPKDGPIQYRLTNIGEVLPSGGKVFTMLDATYVYMDIFLPTREAGQVRFGDEASIVLDAMPNKPIRAAVSFIAAQNEFTPKAVETQSERDKLMFRIRVQIDRALLKQYESKVRSGLPGVAYIRVDPKTPWPPPIEPLARPVSGTGN